MQLVVTVSNQGYDFWLRGTVWTGDKARSDVYENAAEAQAALDKARKFMTARIYKNAQIVPDIQ